VCAPMCVREREHSAHAHVLNRLHAPPWGTMPGGVGVPTVARACPRVGARGEQHLLQHTETR
jgi:hypothetical protein